MGIQRQEVCWKQETELTSSCTGLEWLNSPRSSDIIGCNRNNPKFKMAILHQQIILEHPLDPLEWCPSREYPDWLVVGGYKIDYNTGNRSGGIDLFQLHRSGGSNNPHLTHAATLKGLPGVHDARWHKSQDGWIISAALSDGTLRLYRPPVDLAAPAAADEGGTEEAAAANGNAADAADAAAPPPSTLPEMEELCSCRALGGNVAQCADWASIGGGDPTGQQHVAAVGGSSGTVTLLQLAEGQLRRLDEWAIVDQEVMSTAFDRHKVRAGARAGTLSLRAQSSKR